jgi:SAM-dependent methyltransferase
MDVGCGSGSFLTQLTAFGPVCGLEINSTLAHQAAHKSKLIFSDPLGSPVYHNMQFNLITLLDVLEHIEDDREAVRLAISMLHPGGYLLVTVPACKSLWDRHDEINEHYRRYGRSQLRALLAPHGRLLVLRYLFAALYLPKLAVRWSNRVLARPFSQCKTPPAVLNHALKSILVKIDQISRFAPPPWGTSLLAVLRV